MNIQGKVFDVRFINAKLTEIIIKKSQRGKVYPICLCAYGYWSDKAKELKIKKNDTIRGYLLIKSKLYNGKYYNDLTLSKFEIVPPKEKKVKAENQSQMELEIVHIPIMDDEGNVRL